MQIGRFLQFFASLEIGAITSEFTNKMMSDGKNSRLPSTYHWKAQKGHSSFWRFYSHLVAECGKVHHFYHPKFMMVTSFHDQDFYHTIVSNGKVNI